MNYTVEQLEECVREVQSGKLSVRKAAEMYSIPKSTNGDRISGKHLIIVTHGRHQCIPKEVESTFVQSVKRGVGLTVQPLLLRTNLLCKRLVVANPSTLISKNWWSGLKRRHDLTSRKPERQWYVRARMMNPEVVSKYYTDLATRVDTLDMSDKPQYIWNFDESGKNFEHDPVRVITAKGTTSVVGKTSSKSNNITVMACVNAVGNRMLYMLVVKGKTTRCVHGFNTDAATDVIGEKWFKQVFLAKCVPHRPQLLINSRWQFIKRVPCYSRDCMKYRLKEKIEILALPSHTTHYLQPLDRTVFGPFNTAYNRSCAAFLQSNPLHFINK